MMTTTRCSVDYPHDHPPRCGDPFDYPLLPPSGHIFRLVNGVYHVFLAHQREQSSSTDDALSLFPSVEREVYLRDFTTIYRMIIDGPLYVTYSTVQ